LVENLLSNAIELLQENRTLESYRIAAGQLNQYVREIGRRGTQLIPPLDPELDEYLSQRVSPSQIAAIREPRFHQIDSFHIESCFLARDVALGLTAGMDDDLEKAIRLFDWTVCNVALDSAEATKRAPVHPRWTLLLGHGTEQERAWVFMNLLRQAGIESVYLGYPADSGESTIPIAPSKSPDEPAYRLWLPAALIDGKLYLFDVRLGMPVPGPSGKGVATLDQVLKQPEILNQLSLDEAHPYRVGPKQLGKLVALLESTPGFWAPRMKFLQEKLAGKNRVILWSDIVRVRKSIRQALNRRIPLELWSTPLIVDEATRGNPLLAAYSRAMFQMMGPYMVDSESLNARVAHLTGHYTKDFKKAIEYYMQRRLNPTPEIILKISSGIVELSLLGKQVSGPVQILPEHRDAALRIYSRMREDFTYFLGLLKYEQGEYRVAKQWLNNLYLKRYKKGRWVDAAHYLLGRCAEAEGDKEAAIKYYTMPTRSLQKVGNLIRARRCGWRVPVPSSEAPKARGSESGEQSVSTIEAAKGKSTGSTKGAEKSQRDADKREQRPNSDDSPTLKGRPPGQARSPKRSQASEEKRTHRVQDRATAGN